MSSEMIETPLFAYQIIDEIAQNGIDYSTLINRPQILERYDNDVNKVTADVHKLIALKVVEITKIYDPEEGDDLRLTLTKRGIGILKNPCHE